MSMLDEIEANKREADRRTAESAMGPGALQRLCEAEAAVNELGLGRAWYWTGPLISIGTMRYEHLSSSDSATSLVSMIAAAVRDSLASSLIHAVVRHSGAGDKITCTFENGRLIPLETAKAIVESGYRTRVDSASSTSGTQ